MSDETSDEQAEAMYDDLMDHETCVNCGGSGGFHDCGDDSCCCLDPDEITETCEECHGSGEV